MPPFVLLRLTCTPNGIIIYDRVFWLCIFHKSQTHADAVVLRRVMVASSALYRQHSTVCRGQRCRTR